MILGAIQRCIMGYLARCSDNGGFIGPTAKAEEFRGLDWGQVDRSLAALVRRDVIYKEGIRYKLRTKP